MYSCLTIRISINSIVTFAYCKLDYLKWNCSIRIEDIPEIDSGITSSGWPFNRKTTNFRIRDTGNEVRVIICCLQDSIVVTTLTDNRNIFLHRERRFIINTGEDFDDVWFCCGVIRNRSKSRTYTRKIPITRNTNFYVLGRKIFIWERSPCCSTISHFIFLKGFIIAMFSILKNWISGYPFNCRTPTGLYNSFGWHLWCTPVYTRL